MKSWSKLTDKIQALSRAFKEDFADSDQASVTAALTHSVTDLPNYHHTNTIDTIEPRSEQSHSVLPKSVQKMRSELQPLKLKPDRHLLKKCKYVNKKFIVYKESRKDERSVELFDKEACKNSMLDDPFEFVGTQVTSAYDADPHDMHSYMKQSVLFQEDSADSDSLTVTDNKPAAVQRRCRRQQDRLIDIKLKQLTDDIADAEMYSLIISQAASAQRSLQHDTACHNVSVCINGPTQTHSSQQTTDIQHDRACHDVSMRVNGPTQTHSSQQTTDVQHDVTPDSGKITAAVETEVDVRQVGHVDCVNAGNDGISAVTVAEDHCCVNDVLRVDIDCVRCAPVSCICSTADDSEIHETHVGMSDILPTMLCTSDRATMSHAAEVDSGDISTSSDVLHSTELSVMQQNPLHSEPATVVSVSPPYTSYHDDGFDRTIVKRSYKRRRKAQHKKHKNENTCHDGSGSRTMKRSTAAIIASDVEDYLSGFFDHSSVITLVFS